MIIRGQDFDNALIAEDGSATENIVEIADSGIIEVREEMVMMMTMKMMTMKRTPTIQTNEPYRKRLSDGDSITVNS